ncbi:zinc finger MYM-type protein 4-like isoform X7 [Antennarius striatus]|uniref:zinc finger MYM-type protein 4-like isoform X7 n=1 Tax=Antennarius striatus TaxID=241820 RepID=UPI0035AFFD0A
MASAKRYAYDAQFKLQAISYAAANGNRAAARAFLINESMVRKWRKQEGELRQVKETRRSFRGNKARWPELENRLEQWFLEERAAGRRVSTVTLRLKAVTMARDMNIEHFQGGPSWCDRFMKRRHLNIRGPTRVEQQPPPDVEEETTFLTDDIMDTQMHPDHITDVDEVCLPPDTPVEEGTSTVSTLTTWYENRNTLPKLEFPLTIEGWMDEERREWLREVSGETPEGFLHASPSLLTCDSHITTAENPATQTSLELAIVPRGLRREPQPLDVGVIRAIKKLRAAWERWTSNGGRTLSRTGRQRRANYATVLEWIVDAWTKKVEAPQMCRTCMTTHRMSDMIESKSEEGWLDFFCSTRCLLLHKAQCFSGSERNPAVDKDTEEVKPVLLNVKEEPNDEEYNQNNSFSTLTEDNKDELKVDQSKHEIIQQDGVDRICSDPCNHRFCNMNNMSICDNCHSHCRSPVMLTMKEGSKKMCSAECMAQFKQNLRTLQPCPVCATYCLVVNMVENKNSEDVVELFCSSSCVKASKIQAVCASGVQFICDNCGKATVPAWHLAMSDDSIRNFCTQSCAMAFQETQNSAPSQTAVSSQTPEELPCAQCQCVLSAAPKIIETKDIIHLVCSLTCSEEFKRTNKITGKCEHCKNVRIINDSKRMGKKTCYFCSGGCRELFYQVLEKSWGKYCKSCAYCHCISKTVVAGQHKRKMEKFCSEECRSKHTKLLSQAAQCDTCSRQGKLTQSLALLRDVKHFCDLKCLLHFCSKNIQVVDTESSPQRPADTSKSFPVITNVISLAAALAERARAAGRSKQQGTDSERHGPVSVPDVPSKAVGHVSVQTVYKELKNKSMLCAPLAHNKGVSCATQTTNTKTQTDNIGPGVLPVPVPVYVPVPLLIPKHVCLPVPLPFPVCIPVTSGGPDLTVKPMTEQNQVDPLEENLKSEMKNTSDEKQEKEDRHDKAVTEGQHRQDAHVPNVSDALTPSQYPLELPPPSALDAPLWQETTGNDHNRNKQVVEDVNKETSQRGLSTSKSMKCRKLKSQCGIDAWKRWIQWRESQTNLYFVSTHSATLNEDILLCSASELNDSLCRFITEVKQPDGAPYSPDSLFYLCLSLQQYLLENGRWEDIFSDQTYNKFMEEMTRVLKGFKPSVPPIRNIHSCVEEEFLWSCKQLGAVSPIVLLNTLIFFCCKYFGFTTVEQHRQLSFANLVRYTKTNPDHSKTTFLRFYSQLSTNKPNADGSPVTKRMRIECNDILEMRENTQNPLRCPVRLYEFYLSKCSESVQQGTNLFYLLPQPSCLPSSPLWFSSTPLDSSTIEAILLRILTVRELHGRDADQQTS